MIYYLIKWDIILHKKNFHGSELVKKEQENRAVVSSEKESLKSENLIITESLTFEHSEVVTQSCSVKKVFLKIS